MRRPASELADGEPRRDEEADSPSAAVDHGDRERGRGGGAEKRDHVNRPPDREAAHKTEEPECGKISRSKQADRADKNKQSMSKRADFASLLLRVAAGLIFLPHGYSKVFGSGVAAFAADMPSYGLPIFLGYVAAYAEFFGSIALIAGLLTRTRCVPPRLHHVRRRVRGATPRCAPRGAARHGQALRHSARNRAAVGDVRHLRALVILGPGRFSLDGVLGIEERIVSALRRHKTKAPAGLPAPH